MVIRSMPALPVLILAVLATPVLAQTPDAAEAAQERRAVGLVRALKSNDADTVLRFLEENFAPATWERRSPEEWRQTVGQLMRRLAPMEMQGVEITRPHTLDLLLGPANADDPAATLGFEFENEAPYRIAGLSVELGSPHGRDNDLPLAREDRFSGTALVAHRGEVIFTSAHGLASKRYNAPNSMNTRFDLGSINKAFTKIAVGQLHQQGKLSLDDWIVDHLPDYPNREVAETVTIEQLLEHTSGLGDMFNDTFFRSSRSLYRSPQDYFRVFALFEPGTGRQYSNAGYIVLGAIIEAVSDESYDGYIARHVFEPAGMASSGFFERDGIEPNIAEGYTRAADQGQSGGKRSVDRRRSPPVRLSASAAQAAVARLHQLVFRRPASQLGRGAECRRSHRKRVAGHRGRRAGSECRSGERRRAGYRRPVELRPAHRGGHRAEVAAAAEDGVGLIPGWAEPGVDRSASSVCQGLRRRAPRGIPSRDEAGPDREEHHDRKPRKQPRRSRHVHDRRLKRNLPESIAHDGAHGNR
jgi:CubicO group peptidase (beta-lactamase class C family)